MQLFFLTFFCLTLFASNSIFCRAALITYGTGPLSYTALRALSAAAMLCLLCLVGVIRKKDASDIEAGDSSSSTEERNVGHESTIRQAWNVGSWKAAFFLFLYMFTFSLAYVGLPSAAGTLILNVSVQIAMIGWGCWLGVYPKRLQCAGLAVALFGLALLVSPGLSETPPLWNSFLMMSCGLSWGGFTLCARGAGPASLATAGNFMRCVPAAVLVALAAICFEPSAEPLGILNAVIAGALPSACGYVLWYSIVPRYSIVVASIIQLSVPIITAALAVPILSESITFRLVFCAVLILGGIAVAMLNGKRE